MRKKDHFNIIMAGVIAGIVAITTVTLGVSGTVIGSVLSSILYQTLSKYSENKIDNADFSNLSSVKNSRSKADIDVDVVGEIVYLLPLVVIVIIEVVFLFSEVAYPFSKIFYLLERVTDQNLFRVIGFGMILLSFYPFLKSNNLKKSTGILVLFAGVLFLVRGFADEEFLFSRIASLVLTRFDFIFGLFLLFILLVIIVQVVSVIFSNHNNNGQNNNYSVSKNNSYNRNVSKSKGNNLNGEFSNNFSTRNLNFSDDDFED